MEIHGEKIFIYLPHVRKTCPLPAERETKLKRYNKNRIKKERGF